MATRRHASLTTLMGIALGLVVAAGASAATPLPGKKVVDVATVESTAGKTTAVFSIGVGRCKRPRGAPGEQAEDCAVLVSLKKGGRGTFQLEWQGRTRELRQPNKNSAVLADDVEELQLLMRWQAVVVGNVNQGKGIPGLVVQQEERRGDRVRRRYDAFLARGGKLVHAFTGQEGRGARTWSKLEPADIDHDGGNELVFMTSTTPNDSEADRIEVQIYGWRADVKKLVARNDLRPALKGAIVGMFPDVEAAREMQDRPCTRDLLVLDQGSADLLTSGQVVLAMPAMTRDDADLALEDLKACNENLVGAVKTLTGGVDIDVDLENQ